MFFGRELMIMKRILIGGIVACLLCVKLPFFALAGELPASWAKEYVEKAIAAGFVPLHLQADYSQGITRAEFSALAVIVYERLAGAVYGRVAFDDTNDENIEKLAFIGVVSGVGNNKFEPDSLLTREQAAVILSRLSEALGQPFMRQYLTFADKYNISPWAIEGVEHVSAAGIMSGTGENMFSPLDIYTREQGIITLKRMFNFMQNNEEGMLFTDMNVIYIRTDGYVEDAIYPIIVKITSLAELLEYYEMNKEIYNLSEPNSEFQIVFDMYTEAFFASHYIVIVLLEEESGSIGHHVKGINTDGNIIINRSAHHGADTADMAQWHIIIELDRTFMPEQFRAVIH